MILEMCPAIRSFEQPNFPPLKVLSSHTSQSKVNAEHYCLNMGNVTESKSISIHGKIL